MTKFTLALACLIGAAPLAQAQNPPADPWAPVRVLAGEWRGPVSGELGTGTVTRRYRFILSSEFLQERSMASFPPQPLHPDGAVVVHASFMAYDPLQKTLVFRLLREDQFNGTFVLSTSQSNATRLVFESVKLDNVPATWKARETFELTSPNEIVEIFEVAEGGKPLSVHSRIPFKRN